MTRYIILSFAIILCFCTKAFSEVYRSVDKEGNVSYSDQPGLNSKKMNFRELTTYESKPQKEIIKDGNENPNQKNEQTSEISYSGLRILSPVSKDTIRDNAGNVPVELQVTPTLKIKHGHRFVLSIDGKVVASTTVPRYKLTSIERGSHTLTAQIMDQKNKALTQPVSVNFHLITSAKISKKNPGNGYKPSYTPTYNPKPSPTYNPKPSPTYNPKPSPGYKP